ncbi:MAG: hypothetical protein WAK60_07090 [Sedimentisphaerales bacterium]
MSENEKKDEGQKCCCCQCWKVIFIAIALLAIGAVFGHVMTMKCLGGHHMMGPGGGHGMKACWDRGNMEREGCWEHKFRGGKEVCGEQEEQFEHKAEMGKCKPGCTCPKCSKKGACLSEPNKASCPMMDKMDKKECKFKKD